MASSKSLIALSYSCLGRTLAAVHAVTELVKLRDARVEGEGARSAVGEAAVQEDAVDGLLAFRQRQIRGEGLANELNVGRLRQRCCSGKAEDHGQK